MNMLEASGCGSRIIGMQPAIHAVTMSGVLEWDNETSP